MAVLAVPPKLKLGRRIRIEVVQRLGATIGSGAKATHTKGTGGPGWYSNKLGLLESLFRCDHSFVLNRRRQPE